MADLRVVALIPVRSGSEDVVRAALSTLAEATLSHRGCTGYELFESAAAPDTFVTVESWQGQADLDAALQTEDIATALAAAEGHLSGDIAIHPLGPGHGVVQLPSRVMMAEPSHDGRSTTFGLTRR